MRDHDGFLGTLREEGAAEVERVLAEARSRAEEIIASAEAESRDARFQSLERARREARRESARRLAERAAIASRDLLSLRQERIEAVLERAREVLEFTDPGPAVIRRLARESVSYLPSGTARLRSRREGVAIVEEIVAERPDLEAVVEVDPELAGVIAATGNEDLVVEGTLTALLESSRAKLAVFLAREIEGSVS